MKKFNPKTHLGKQRVYTKIPHAPRVSKLWIWNPDDGEYQPPPNGGTYFARRYETVAGKRKRTYGSFHSLDEARKWQSEVSTPPRIDFESETLKDVKPFGAIVAEWKKRTFPGLAETTRVAYDKLTNLYFGSLVDLPIQEITPKRVDHWLDELKDPNGRGMMSTRRKSFRHELEVLSAVCRYHENYADDPNFRFPIKQRHWDSVDLNRPYTPVSKDLTEEEFLRFREHLLKAKFGDVMAPLATVQFYQALRISEAAGLFHEDLLIDRKFPHNSRLKIVRAVCWPRQKGNPSFIKGGFKNAAANKGTKEQPMFPETFEALMPLTASGSRGLVFQLDGKHLEYRQIQYAYDMAFKRADLPYSATHVMRHGGCRKIYNEVPDITIAQQILGNSDLQSVQVYAKRHAGALTKVAQGHWERKYAETGCKWLHPAGSKKII